MDKISRERRSENMRRIRSANTKPEMEVRRLVHKLGYRYRLHKKGLAGKPDLVFSGRQKVVFVHGCFWHQHPDPACVDARLPKSRREYWVPKLERNQQRDAENATALSNEGWQYLIVWECQLKDIDRLTKAIMSFLDGS